MLIWDRVLFLYNVSYTFNNDTIKYTDVADITEKCTYRFVVDSGDDGVVVLPFNINNSNLVKVDFGGAGIYLNNGNGVAMTKEMYKIASIGNYKIASSQINHYPGRFGNQPSTGYSYSEKNRRFTVTVIGIIKRLDSSFSSVGGVYCTKDKMIEIEKWGGFGLETIDLSSCTNLERIATPSNLENTFESISNFNSSFSGCTGLTGNVPEFWTMRNGTIFGNGCFYECTGVSNYSSIPANWKSLEQIQ